MRFCPGIKPGSPLRPVARRVSLKLMLEVLEIPEIRHRVDPVSVERYHRMIELGLLADRPVELIDGVIVEKMSKSPLHVYLVDWLWKRLHAHASGAGWWVRKEDPLTLARSEPEPDLSVVSGSREEHRHAQPGTARFIIEVAIHSLAVDRAKTKEYARAGVPEVWIVQPEERTTEVHRHPAEDRYTEVFGVPADALLESVALPGFTFTLAAALAK